MLAAKSAWILRNAMDGGGVGPEAARGATLVAVRVDWFEWSISTRGVACWK